MSVAALTFDALFDPDFLGSLSRLRLSARRVAAGGRHGERLSRDLGAGIEFKDYRPYSAGDDLRAIDWNIYRRLGRVFVRLFEEEQDLPLYLMPDVSGSMFLEGSPRVIAALRCSLALAVISLNHHDSAALFPFAEQLQVLSRSRAGKASIMPFARQLVTLAEPQERTRTDLCAALRYLARLPLRRGLLVMVSDFFDPAGVEGLREALRPIRHRLLLVQLVRSSDAEPTLQGDLRLRDCETGDTADLTITASTLARYRQAYRQFSDGLADLARSRHAGLLRLDVEGDLVNQLSTLLTSGALRA